MQNQSCDTIPAKDPSTETESNGNMSNISRREFLAAATAALIMLGLAAPSLAYADEKEQEEAVKKHSEGHDLNENLDMGTAIAVFVNFLRHVGYKSAIKGIDLNFHSAWQMNALALLRIAALKMLGGKEGSHMAKHEWAEIEHGLLPVPLLVFLSDLTTTELKVNPDEIFKSSEESPAHTETDYTNPNRPELSDKREVWEHYLEKINVDISKKAAQVAGITTVLGPIGTTYTSSSLANTMKADMARMLFEQSYAKEVLQAQGTDPIHHNDIFEAAKKRTDTVFNGKMGYSKLQLTLAANMDGTWGLGDPPEVYFALNYMHSPKTMATAHALGGLYSEITSAALNFAFLKHVGVSSKGFVKEFIKSQISTLKALKSAPGVSKGQKNVKHEILQALKEGGLSGVEKIGPILEKLPSSALQLRFGDYIKKKWATLKLLSKRHRDIQEWSQKLMSSINAEHAEEQQKHLDIFKHLKEHSAIGDKGAVKELQDRLSAITDDHSQFEATELAGLLEGLMQEPEGMKAFFELVQDSSDTDNTDQSDEDILTQIKEKISTEAAAEEDQSKLDSTIHVMHEVQKVLDCLSSLSEANGGGIDSFIDALSKEENPAEAVKKATRGDLDSTFNNAFKQMTEIAGAEDAIPGHEDPDLHHEPKEAPSSEFMKKIQILLGGLSHSAQEVMFALMTQIPSVPALAHLANKTIAPAVGVEKGKAPTSNQLKNIARITCYLDAAMSSSADNVAAYLFTESVMGGFFQARYGNDIFKKDPDVKSMIGIIAKMIAEAGGSLTKLGNGPNFSQDKCKIIDSDKYAQGIDIDRVSMSMGETLPHNNLYATGWNVLTCEIAIGILNREIDRLDAKYFGESKSAKNDDTMDRRNFFRNPVKWLGIG